jgi:hypothetical protein
MKSIVKGIMAGAGLALLAGCAGNVTMEQGTAAPPANAADPGAPAPASTAYRYNGEKYGHVTVQWSDALAADTGKTADLKALYLDKAIVSHLLKHQLYNRSADCSVVVMIDGFRFRNTANAVIFGVLSGVDDLGGTVTLQDKDGAVLARFRIDTDYGLGGLGGGQMDARLGWLAGKFSELTATTIQNPESLKPAAASAAGGSPADTR